jgi:hypothetical protein
MFAFFAITLTVAGLIPPISLATAAEFGLALSAATIFARTSAGNFVQLLPLGPIPSLRATSRTVSYDAELPRDDLPVRIVRIALQGRHDLRAFRLGNHGAI